MAETRSPRDIARIAEKAFVFAYPLVLTAARMAHETAVAQRDPWVLRAPANQLVHGSPGGAGTVRMSGWLDLGPEPLVLSTPGTNGRYYVLWLRDAWNSVFASVGARTTGAGPRAFAILGPGRHGIHLPPAMTPIAAPTRLVRLAGCVEAPPDGAPPERLPQAFGLAPLSRSHQRSATPPLPPGGTASAEAQLDAMDVPAFFGVASRLVADNPPERADRPALDWLRVLGGWDALDHERRAAVEEGVRRARAAVGAEAARSPEAAAGGWRIAFDAGRYGTDYLQRAAAAQGGPRADPAADELAAFLDRDADGRPLSGGARYVLRFPAGAWPPVHGFWTLSSVAPAGRAGRVHHSIGDRDGLTLDADGALSIHVQDAPPARAHAANWLRTPADRFSVALRLYWPREEVLQHRWAPPALLRAEAP